MMHRAGNMRSTADERWLILAVLFLARTAIGFQFQAVAAVSPLVLAGLGINYAQLGLLIGLYLLPGIVIAYPGGWLGQYFGDRRACIFGLALMVAGGLLMAAGTGYSSIFAGRLIAGIGAVIANVLLTKMATDWFVGREIGTALALLVSSWPIGIGIALVTLPRLALHASVSVAFATTGAAAALVLVLIAAIYRLPPVATTASSATGAEASRLSPRELGLVSLAGGVWMLFNVGYILVVSFGPSLLVAKGWSATAANSAVSLMSWTIVVTIPLGGVLIDRLGRATLLMIASFAAFGLGTVLMPFAPSAGLIAFVGAVAGLPAAAMMVLPSEVLSKQNRAVGMGVFFTWYYAGMALLTPAAGVLRDASGAVGAPLYFAGGLQFAALAVLVAFRLSQHRFETVG